MAILQLESYERVQTTAVEKGALEALVGSYAAASKTRTSMVDGGLAEMYQIVAISEEILCLFATMNVLGSIENVEETWNDLT